jgi:LysR family glycine cleavage system transcriptional activator
MAISSMNSTDGPILDGSRRLPPLNGLKAFEAAARHMSISKAADELHVTPGAVSRQIRALEDVLGARLFRRLSHSLELTEAGRAGLPGLRAGFDELASATRRMREQTDRRPLAVWVAPSFAAKWLVPRLHGFSAKHPGIDLRISAATSLIDRKGQRNEIPASSFREHEVDVAIRFGAGDYPGCRVDALMPASVIPVCSPALLEAPDALRAPADLRGQTLLHDDTGYQGRPDWDDWLAAAGVSDVDARRGLRFNHVSLALEAAIDGQGVALTLEPLAVADVAAGRLVFPFELRLPVEQGYFVVCLEEMAHEPDIAAFRKWLLAEAGPFRAVSPAGSA